MVNTSSPSHQVMGDLLNLSPLSLKFLYITPLLYLAPKGLNWLTTRPEEVRQGILGRIDQLRHKCANFHGYVLIVVGQREWSKFAEIIIDNAWISSLVLSILLQNAKRDPLTNEGRGQLAIASLGICGLIWLVRYQTTRYLPSTARWLATRSQR